MIRTNYILILLLANLLILSGQNVDDKGIPWMAWGNGDCYMIKLKQNMIETDGPIIKDPYRNYAEGSWLLKQGDIYNNVYVAVAPGTRPEQIFYFTAPEN